MDKSYNGWPVLEPDSPKLRTLVIPAKNGAFKLRTRGGSAGFLLAHFALWYAEVIEKVAGKILDDWGYAKRPVRDADYWSCHASGTAIDLNALLHPMGKVRTGIFRRRDKVTALHERLRWMRNTLRWGGDYVNRKDEMHFEVIVGLAAAEKEARRLMNTPRGRRILKANPGLKKEILA